MKRIIAARRCINFKEYQIFSTFSDMDATCANGNVHYLIIQIDTLNNLT